ncbi:hypothetical protein [Alcanivorax hongdengensis]|uniref:hypothetical protein n=1 Tax=Alcanivorax hongdengensis TaxID=519051 RepID=UPI0012FB0858|nr:hypothetical protein [Alcanivorax hongdengensis]
MERSPVAELTRTAVLPRQAQQGRHRRAVYRAPAAAHRNVWFWFGNSAPIPSPSGRSPG